MQRLFAALILTVSLALSSIAQDRKPSLIGLSLMTEVEDRTWNGTRLRMDAYETLARR
ncbi:MAG: hypothetical protein GDA40_06575 [Rhodobacteraceae bacterium]|nr:hypothetical protein [Paracoccaceae bacterium]